MKVSIKNDVLGIVKQTILDCLRSRFDDKEVGNAELIKIMNTTKEIDKDFFEEMENDLKIEGVIN